jgi:hypothetical protein
MKKLSEQFLEMSQHTAALENRAAASRRANQEEFDKNVAEAKARVQSAQSAFTARLGKVEASLAEQWSQIDEAFASQITRAQRNMDEHKNAMDLAHARRQADAAESYAEVAAEFADLAAAEAVTAMIEAIQARARANSLEHTPS